MSREQPARRDDSSELEPELVMAELSPQPDRLHPVAPASRIDAVDVLRGFALMGILIVNIQSFALSGYQDVDPRIGAEFTGLSFASWVTIRLFFQSKMYTIFSMLFGAGLVLMDQRARDREQRLWPVYFRRLFWLCMFGLLHAYFVWEGDILVAYAMCGVLLYPCRRLSGKVLIPLGLIGYFLMPVVGIGLGFLIGWAEAAAGAAQQAGDQATEFESTVGEIWHKLESELQGTPEQLEVEQRIMRGGYWSLFRQRAAYAIGIQIAFVLILNWGFLGVMLLGVALMKAGVFTASKSRRFYALLALTGYVSGLPLVAFSLYDLLAHDFGLARRLLVSFQFFALGSLLVSLGHVGFVLRLYKSTLGPWLMKPLAAAGRMALTNYLCQSLICAALFYGWGFGLFGRLDRFQLIGVVVAIWIVQLAGSSLWLRCFRFGPAEWLWRTLTYRTRQPLRVSP